MAAKSTPEIGGWYTAAERDSFEVIAIDDEAGTIDIQYYDGSVEELDMDAWQELEVASVSSPEDWTGPFDDLEKADLDEAEAALHGGDYSRPLDVIDRYE